MYVKETWDDEVTEPRLWFFQPSYNETTVTLVWAWIRVRGGATRTSAVSMGTQSSPYGGGRGFIYSGLERRCRGPALSCD